MEAQAQIAYRNPSRQGLFAEAGRFQSLDRQAETSECRIVLFYIQNTGKKFL